jgi:opacity protein-like surface antigen
MRKFLILAATAASALAFATPAAAQWYPQPQYNNGYNGYGNNGYGYNDYAGNLGYRINRLQQHINQFDSRNIISNREARSLRAQAYDLERQLRYGQGYNVERRPARAARRYHRPTQLRPVQQLSRRTRLERRPQQLERRSQLARS